MPEERVRAPDKVVTGLGGTGFVSPWNHPKRPKTNTNLETGGEERSEVGGIGFGHDGGESEVD